MPEAGGRHLKQLLQLLRHQGGAREADGHAPRRHRLERGLHCELAADHAEGREAEAHLIHLRCAASRRSGAGAGLAIRLRVHPMSSTGMGAEYPAARAQ